jgi:LysW-gamma-L-lysine carboxypeptidase
VLLGLVSRYSPSCEEGEAVRFLVGWMAAHGFDAWVDDAGNACGARGPEDAAHTLVLLGHIDTYPGNLPVEVRDGLLYGRGSVDAKGPLAAFAEATAAATIPEGWRVLVVGAVEEESATSKGARFIRDVVQPQLCIIGEPSSASRVTLGYKGRLLVDVSLTQPVAHTARPEPSVGGRGVALWNAVEAWANEVNAGVERYFDQLMVDLRSIHTSSDFLSETVDMTLGFRLPPRLPPDAVLARVEALAGPQARVRGYSAEHAYLGDKNNALVRAFLRAIRGQGGQPGFVVKTGTSDMNVVGTHWGCPIVAYGPGDSNLDHTPEEHLALAEYAQAVITLKAVIEGLEKH